MTTHYIYDFDSWSSTPDKALLGSKGAGLAEMFRLNLSVPHGFTITTELCKNYYANQSRMPSSFESEMLGAIKRLEEKTGRTLGGTNPLLLSVRSGASSSMPGMMDTILNLGMNDEVVK